MSNFQPSFRANRRSVLKGAGALAVGVTFLPYKSMAAEEKKLNLYNWDTYIGENTLADFNTATGIEAKMDLFGSNDELFAKLKAGNPGYDVIVPSGNYIERMVKAKMLMPLDHKKIPNFANYDKVFQDAAFDPGRKYSIAYMWGTFGIGYRKSKAKGVPDSWKFLVDSPDFAGRISMQGDAEHAIGVALKYLGYNWNSTNATELKKAQDLLIAAKKGVKTFAKDNGQDLLASGEVDICSEYSGDIVQVMKADTTNDLSFVLPKEGGNVWQDTLAIAAGAPHPDNAHAFLNFVCDPKANKEIVDTIHYATPNAAARALMDDDYKNNTIIFPTPAELAKCDPSLYLGEDAEKARDDIWTAIQAA